MTTLLRRLRCSMAVLASSEVGATEPALICREELITVVTK